MPVVTDDPEELDRADRIVLPGVGAFEDAMRNLRDRGLDEALAKAVLAEGAPLLGICLGMQLLAERGTEGTETPGLGFVAGVVARLEPTATDRRIPHVGWNEVHEQRPSTLLQGIPRDADFYFVHSYHVRCNDRDDVAAMTPYCGGFSSVIERRNIFGTQFHPEKSQRHGFALLKNFLAV